VLGDPLALSVALVVVLIALGALVVVSNLRVSSALRLQSAALETDSLFTDARLEVAQETLAVRTYRAEPSAANQKSRTDRPINAVPARSHPQPRSKRRAGATSGTTRCIQAESSPHRGC